MCCFVVAQVIQDLKAPSSRWIKEDVAGFTWQEGQGALGVSESQRESVVDYIAHQAKYHRKWTYEQEYLALVRKACIEFDSHFCLGNVPGGTRLFLCLCTQHSARLGAGLSCHALRA